MAFFKEAQILGDVENITFYLAHHYIIIAKKIKVMVFVFSMQRFSVCIFDYGAKIKGGQ